MPVPNLREVYLFRLESNPPAYLWTGQGDLDVPPDALAPSLTRYTGAGELLDLPALQQLINGRAERVEFSLGGATVDAMRLALEDNKTVKGATVRIGSLVLGADGQPAMPVDWEWEGVASGTGVSSSVDAGGNRQRRVTLSVGSSDTGRSRPDLDFFTDASQRRRSPDDAFFSHVAGIAAGSTRRFGPK